MQRAWLLKDATWVGWLAVGVTMGFVGWTSSAVGQEASQVPMAERGVVVEEVGEGSTLEKAGLQAGDVVFAWERLPAPPANPQGAQGTIESVFDWIGLKFEQAPRGTVKLTGQRGGEVKVFEVVPGKWKATLRAKMPGGMLEDYARGEEFIEAEEPELGIDLWHKVAGTAENQAADGRLRCWLHLRIGDAWGKARQWEKAHSAYGSALEAAQDPMAKVAIWQAVGDAYEKASEFETAREAYGSAQEIRERTWGESLAFARGLNDLGRLDAKQGRLDAAEGYGQRALEIRQKLAPGSLDVARTLNLLGILADKRGDLAQAAEYYERDLEITQKLVPDSLDVATSLNGLGSVANARGDLAQAAEYYERGLKITQKLAPGSLDVATSLNNLGAVAYARGDLAQAAEYFEGSLEIRQKLAPGSLAVAASLSNLGILAHDRGDLDQAAEYYEQDLEITQKLALGSLDVAASLSNLGILAHNRGDLAQAAEYYEQDLEITQKLAPGSLDVAAGLNNLGILAHDRGDLDRAAEYYEHSLEITQKLAPGSRGVAHSLQNLGIVAADRGDLDRASVYYEGSLEITQKLAPGSLDVATSLNNLGDLAWKRGDLDRAAEYSEGALAIRQRLAPGSLDVATSLYNLGDWSSDRGDLDRAAEYFEGALEIEQRLAPGSSTEAATLYGFATLLRKQNQPQTALAFLFQALQAIEKQVTRLGGSRDVQAGFRAERVAYYRDTIDLSLELQQPAKAFQVLERSRARSFLAQLAERDLVFSDIPKELERQRRQIAWSYNETQDEIAKLHPREQAEEIETLLTRLRQLGREYEDITEKIVKTSPKLGALRYPKPIGLNGARQALDPGTAMLSYSVGEDETHLFILTRDDGLEVRTVPLGEKELRGEVKNVLRLQERRSSTLLYTKPLRQVGEHLYQALILPAEESIAKSERVLIVPDGPLHLLPFALLVRKTGPGEGHEDRDFEYLVEWKPLHSVLSATVYSELKRQRRSQKDEATDVLALAAFGDPQYLSERPGGDLAADRSVDVYVRAAVERGFDNRPLPYSREEVNRIAALYPKGAARAFLGAEASEEQAKSVGKSARILHFATHGRFDDQIPLNSYLALTIPKEFRKDQDNGLLQAWEIFEDVRLDADLVVLSACESGLGDEIDGEGLRGLTRAFQFAGARTVASSLWQVNDRATAELMLRFYRYLREGMPKDEALRAAQMELIRGPIEVTDADGRKTTMDASAPYYWAAFQIYGDWR